MILQRNITGYDGFTKMWQREVCCICSRAVETYALN